MEESVVNTMFVDRFFESEEYDKIYSNVADYDNEDHTSWEEAKKVINQDLTGKPKHDIHKDEADMSEKKMSCHEAKIIVNKVKKLEEEIKADKKLLLKKMKENIQPDDLFIVVPEDDCSYDFDNNYQDVRLVVGDNNGFAVSAGDIKSLLSDSEIDPEDIKVYECPDYIKESEEVCPEISDVDSLIQIYDAYSFFDVE